MSSSLDERVAHRKRVALAASALQRYLHLEVVLLRTAAAHESEGRFVEALARFILLPETKRVRREALRREVVREAHAQEVHDLRVMLERLRYRQSLARSRLTEGVIVLRRIARTLELFEPQHAWLRQRHYAALVDAIREALRTLITTERRTHVR